MATLSDIALIFNSGIGHITAKNLLAEFGTSEDVFAAKKQHLTAIEGIGPKIAAAILKKDGFQKAEKELKFTEKYKIKPLFFTDEDYPQRLKNCYDAPALLFYKGKANLNPQKVISVVGTRKSTDYGKQITEQLLQDISVHDPLIISGLAYGIDSLAHKNAVKHNLATVGVLGHGLDRIYPAQNRSLAESMLDKGGLLTEYPSGTNPDRENFPKRNRVIAGLGDATIVVEASIKGGALITAEIANSYNRDVFAFPGRIADEFSSGCNYLIKTNRASLIISVADLEYILGWAELQAKKGKPQLKLPLNLSADERKIAEILRQTKTMSIDELAIKTNWRQSQLAVVILGLEMQGVVISLPGKTYKLA